MSKNDNEQEQRKILLEQRMKKDKTQLISEIEALEAELNRLKELPLLGAIVVDIINDKILIMSTQGSFHIIDRHMKINGKELKPGMFVGLNQRTSAIVDLFPVSSKKLKEAREKFFVTEYIWKNKEESS